MFIEWKQENRNVRHILLYFLDLYLSSFLKEMYFSKGNITSAKKLMATLKEYEIPMTKYTYICFQEKKKNIKEVGFRNFATPIYMKAYIDKALDETWFSLGQHPFSLYEKIRFDITNLHNKFGFENKLNKIAILNELLNGNFCQESMMFLIKTKYLDELEYQDVLTGLEKSLKHINVRLDLLMKRGVLPKTLDKLIQYPTFKEWCEQDVEPKP